MTTNGTPQFYIAEVIKNPDVESYKDENDKGNDHFLITVRTIGTSEQEDLDCRPANSHIKQIPLLHEHVLIFQANNEFSSADKTRNQWYYFPAYSIQSNINHNALPVAELKEGDVNDIKQEDNIPLGETFEQKTVSSMQPYEGDVVVEGRWGNSIRLGSTITKAGQYTKKPNYIGQRSGDPIIILSNSVKHESSKFITEDSKNDESSLYLTTTQAISDLVLNKSLNVESTKENQYSESQFVGIANRIVLQAKTNNIILDGENRISILSNKIMLGEDNATEPLVLGEKLELIIAGCRAGTAGSPFYHQAQGLPQFQQAYSKLSGMKSSKVRTI